MYDFVDTNKHSENSNKHDDDIYIYDLEKYLTEILPKLIILGAEGRSSQKININTADTSGDGKVFLSKTYEPINITLVGRFLTYTVEDLQEHIQALYRWLQGNQIKFSFRDDKDFYRIGTVENVSIDDYSVFPIVKIDIYCSDPFKYSVEYTKEELKSEVKYDRYKIFKYGIKNNYDLLQPTEIRLKYNLESSVTSNGVTINSCDKYGNIVKQIKTLPYSEHQEENEMIIKFKSIDGDYLNINGYTATDKLNIASNIADFGIVEDGYLEIKNDDLLEAYAYYRVKDLG